MNAYGKASSLGRRRLKMLEPCYMVIAGGGTGGHLFPGIAAAQEFLSRHPNNRVAFISVGNAFEKEVLAKYGFKLFEIPAAGLKGFGLFRQVAALLKMLRGVLASMRLLKNCFYPRKPDIVLGVGGYASAPVVAAGSLLKLKNVIHEQNIRPGIANRLLAALAHRIYVSFPKTPFRLLGQPEPSFIRKKVMVSGNPVRREVMLFGTQGKPDGDAGFTVLIIGGSQGAHRINMTMMAVPDYLQNVCQFIHQTGKDDAAKVRQAYKRQGFQAVVAPFFEDMASQYRLADLVVCRAGATSIAEIAALGKPAILIPFPHAADNHQELNAASLVSVGGAEMILESELTPLKLAARIDYYAENPDHLGRIGANAKSLGCADAARVMIDDCYKLIETDAPLKSLG